MRHARRNRWSPIATLAIASTLLVAAPVLATDRPAALPPGVTVTLSIANKPSFRPGESIPYTVGCFGIGEHVDAGVGLASADPPYGVVAGSSPDAGTFDGTLVIPAATPAGPYNLTAGCFDISGDDFRSDPVRIVVSGDPITTTTTTTTPEQATDKLSLGSATQVSAGETVAYSGSCSWTPGEAPTAVDITLRETTANDGQPFSQLIAHSDLPADGTFEGSFEVPLDAPFGNYLVETACYETNGFASGHGTSVAVVIAATTTSTTSTTSMLPPSTTMLPRPTTTSTSVLATASTTTTTPAALAEPTAPAAPAAQPVPVSPSYTG